MRFALAGGAIAAAAVFVGVVIVGKAGTIEGGRLVESLRPTLRFFASGVLSAGATVLALMLTILGLSYSTDFTFSRAHFHRIRNLSALVSGIILIASGVLVFLLLPVAEAGSSAVYRTVTYYSLLAAGSVLGGMMTAVVLMLHRTITELARIGQPEQTSALIQRSPE